MTITLPPELAAKIRVRMESGRFQTEEEMIADALRAWEEEDEQLAELRAKIKAGFDQLDQGLGAPLDIEAFLKRVNARYDATVAHGQ